MDTNTSTSLSNAFESTLSEFLPDLTQLLQNYKVSKTLEIALEPDYLNMTHLASAARCTCCFINGILLCGSACPFNSREAIANSLGLDYDQEKQLGKDVESLFSMILPRLNESMKQANETFFKLHLLINPATADHKQSVVCKWDSSDPQGHILKCSIL